MAKLKFVTLIFLLMIIGCTAKYMPLKEAGVSISEEFGVVKTKDFVFAAENRYWVKEPTELTNYFTTFYVSIRNRSSELHEIKMNDFALIDEAGNQYDIISNEYIEILIQPSQFDYLSLDKDSDSELIDISDIIDEEKNLLEKWRKGKENLIRYSFRFGNLHAGARKSGFIFFPRLAESNKRCKLIYKDVEIKFSRVEEEGE